MIIRKISVGSNMSDSMNFVVGNKAFGDFKVYEIVERNDGFYIYIQDYIGIKLWKKIQLNCQITVEYNLNF